MILLAVLTLIVCILIPSFFLLGRVAAITDHLMLGHLSRYGTLSAAVVLYVLTFFLSTRVLSGN